MGQLLAWFYHLVPNYGLSIIFLTITVRIAMIPLAVKQAHAMVGQRANAAKMQKLKPELAKLKEKHKDDRVKFAEEQRRLYNEHNVSLMGSVAGCLPSLLQLPVFMAMYQVLRGCPGLMARHGCYPARFIPDTSKLHEAILRSKATFLTLNLNFKPSDVLKAHGAGQAWPYYTLCIVMGVTMWYQTKLMTAGQGAVDPQMAQTQKLTQFMPLLIVVFSVGFPVGLTLYWTSTNVWTIGQQYFLLKRFGPNAAPAAKSEKPAGATQAMTSNGSSGKARQADPAPNLSNGKAPSSNSKALANGNGSKSQGKSKGSGARKKKKKKNRR